MQRKKLQALINKLLIQLTYLRKQIIIKMSNDYLGIDFTPADLVPDEYGCAEAVTTILARAGAMPRVIPGTWTLWDYLNNNKSWSLIAKPQEGDIIISPTGMSSLGRKAPFVGHVGIVGKNGMIYANDSYTGKWSAIYTEKTWRERYEKKGGYPVYFYTYISLV